MFDGKPVMVVERFDRTWQDGVLYRLPQEDLCQSLGIPPMRKYQSDGGPGVVDVMSLLNGAIAPYEDRLTFMKTQIVFWLLAAIDGHAKNFSIFLAPAGYRLTPLYDVMSAAPYPQFPIQKVKLAMAIGDKGYYRLNQIQLRHFYQTGKKAGLNKQDMDNIFSDLSTRAEDAIAEAESLATDAGVPESTTGPILEGVQKRAGLIVNA
jgi:serine/threonine-protein kinase HipA